MSNSGDECGIIRGLKAELSVLRTASQLSPIAQTAVDQFLRPGEKIVHAALRVHSRIQEQQQSAKEKEEEEEEENDDDSDSLVLTSCQGVIIVTSERLLFWSELPYEVDYDMIVPAKCIDLHALSSACPDVSNDEDDQRMENSLNPPLKRLYLQMRCHSESSGPEFIEWTLLIQNPDIETDHQHEEATRSLFNALSQLISLHPIDPNDDMNDDEYGSSDDDMIFAPSNQATDRLNGIVATLDERDLMLERLDRLLIEPPELEEEQETNIDGQFDDADSLDNVGFDIAASQPPDEGSIDDLL